ncbi:MAG: FkbM family methyltransferase [Alphaproteobacteria bacterium]|nr:FkbM family methyltransferase [Alphaproteobacteria bacterium]MBU0797803.1 FkbM family methyltransferase [Alphaproteobacteria bacterium]MBU0888396.1 FkbM family methyltransferase [Alphaproteobacteria bacterium]MBU1814707.1 FkbM family methyltransferase [Alphaproteobacteria bacterium]MBU2090339.1 FkbM family methyltransferase [Alphaproteobacteria bacterium]
MDIPTTLGLARSLIVYRLNLAKQARLRRLYGRFVRPGDLAFDVGAHVGDRIWALRSLGCRVVAVEPQPAPLALLRRFYRNAPDVVLEGCALGAETGRADLLVSRRNPTVSSLSQDWVADAGQRPDFAAVAWDRPVSVAVDTLDRLIDRHGMPQFCKIDVEGFEAEVLRGLTRPIPVLSFEFLAARPDLAGACLSELSRLTEYRFNIAYGEKLVLELPAWVDAAAMNAHLHSLSSGIASGDIYAMAGLPERA